MHPGVFRLPVVHVEKVGVRGGRLCGQPSRASRSFMTQTGPEQVQQGRRAIECPAEIAAIAGRSSDAHLDRYRAVAAPPEADDENAANLGWRCRDRPSSC